MSTVRVSMIPREYERTISEIVQSIFERVEGLPPERVKYGNENRWMGISGCQHQIDVSVEGRDDVTLIECKYWNRKVPIQAVLAFFGRVHDIRQTIQAQVHPVIATKVGFQSGAESFAKHYHIDLQIIPSASAFGFMYKHLLLIKPAPISARASVGKPTVVISDTNGHKT